MSALDRSSGRSRAFFAAVMAFAIALAVGTGPVRAQDSIGLISDTETERLLRSYLDPLVKAGGLSPSAVHIYLVNDASINAFVAEGQNVFINTGTLMELETPNEVIGILAHETGHMTAGHLVRMGKGMHAAIIPMLLSMAAGIAAIAAGAGDVGAALLGLGQQVAEREFLRYTRTQESSADQAGMRYLNATHQSGRGLLKVFRRFEEMEVLTDRYVDKFAQSHPASRERMDALEALIEASPYRDTPDSPQSVYAYTMMRAKLRGYIQSPQEVLYAYPESDTSKPARYARAMAYFRTPDMQKALAEINSLVAEEPNNPYFLEMQGQINVEMGQVRQGIEPYRKAVRILPDAPQIRVALAAAMLGTEDTSLTAQAQVELETALRQDNESAIGWYMLATAYERLGQHGKAQLATAERFFAMHAYPEATQFAYLAQQGLMRGSTDWQRANDILLVAQTQTETQSR